MEKPKLSIIILSFNTKSLLKQCLSSILTAWKKIDNLNWKLEIIVIDNGSTDQSQKYLIDERKKINTNQSSNLKLKIIFNKINLGFAKGSNLGLEEARGEYIMLLNSDTIVEDDALEKLISFLDKTPNVAVSPLLKLLNNQPQQDYYMKFPNLWQIFLYHNRLTRPIVMRTPLKKLICQEPKLKPFEVDQLPGAALLASRSIWEKVGFLDEDYYFLFEDVDWCWRAKKNGVKLFVVPQAEIIHIGGASWKKKLGEKADKFYYQFFASMLLFTRKNYSKTKSKIFELSILLNFILTFKPKLALYFLKNRGLQKGLW